MERPQIEPVCSRGSLMLAQAGGILRIQMDSADVDLSAGVVCKVNMNMFFPTMKTIALNCE